MEGGVKKICKILIVLFFLINNVMITSSNVSSSIDSIPFLSPSIGSITDTYKGSDNKPTVIIIKNVYCNSEVQERIRQILVFLKDYYKDNLNTVCVEGDIGYINTNLLSNIPNSIVKSKVLDYFVKQGAINGYELYSAFSPSSLYFYGIEDWDVYTKNIRLLKDGVIRYNGWEKEFDKFYSWFMKNKKKIYNKNLKKIENVEEIYQKKLIDKGVYAYKISVIYKSIFKNIKILNKYPILSEYIKNYYLLSKLDSNVLNIEKNEFYNTMKNYLTNEQVLILDNFKLKSDIYAYNMLLKNIVEEKNISLKNSFPNLALYFTYLSNLEKIDRDKLYVECNDYVYKVKDSLTINILEKDMIYMDRYINILEDYLTNNINNVFIYEDFKKNKDNFFKLISKYYKDSLNKVKEKVNIMSNFYDLAVKRSESLVGNLLECQGNVLGLITGRFYTENITSNLRAQGVSYIVINPYIIESKKSNEIYLDRLLGKVMNYDSPVISSCIYTRQFREEFTEILMRYVKELYINKAINSSDVDIVLSYVTQTAIENNKEQELIKLISDLVISGYKSDGINKPIKGFGKLFASKKSANEDAIDEILKKYNIKV